MLTDELTASRKLPGSRTNTAHFPASTAGQRSGPGCWPENNLVTKPRWQYPGW